MLPYTVLPLLHWGHTWVQTPGEALTTSKPCIAVHLSKSHLWKRCECSHLFQHPLAAVGTSLVILSRNRSNIRFMCLQNLQKGQRSRRQMRLPGMTQRTNPPGELPLLHPAESSGIRRLHSPGTSACSDRTPEVVPPHLLDLHGQIKREINRCPRLCLSVHLIPFQIQVSPGCSSSAAPESCLESCLQGRLANSVLASPASAEKENPVEAGWNR